MKRGVSSFYPVTAAVTLLLLTFVSGCDTSAFSGQNIGLPQAKPSAKPSPGTVVSYGTQDLVTPGQAAATPYQNPVLKVTFPTGQSSRTINLDNLQGHSVYLAKLNKGSTVTAEELTGGVSSSDSQNNNIELSGSLRNEASYADDQKITRIERTDILEFNSLVFTQAQAVQDPDFNRNIMRSAALQRQQSQVGDLKQFWVDEGGWHQIDATMRSEGTYCNIWIDNACYDSAAGGSGPNNNGKIGDTQAGLLAVKFDLIYEKETNVLGFEYGGSNQGIYSGQPLGGVDGEPKIIILVYDIEADAATTRTTNSGTVGFFWGKDELSQDYLDTIGSYKTNNAEMFYIDVDFADRFSKLAYSTLAHEFQHMIHYNRKNLINGKSSSTWYNEMLSMAVEDMLGEELGIGFEDNWHVINARKNNFLTNYYSTSPLQWMTNNIYVSYSNACFFGAYLTRNFGGAQLLKAIMDNDSVDAASISEALDTDVNPHSDAVRKIDKAISRYPQAVVFSGTSLPDNEFSFDRQVTNSVNGIDYTFKKFDIWSFSNPKKSGYKGPLVWRADVRNPIQGNAFALHSMASWRNVTGELSITLQKPADSNIELYLLVR